MKPASQIPLVCLSALLALAFSGCHDLSPGKGSKAPDAGAPAGPDDQAGAGPAGQCQYESPADWQTFLTKYASDPRWTATCEDGSCDSDQGVIAYSSLVSTQIQAVFDGCAAFIAATPQIAKCTENYRKFVPVWLRQHDSSSYGFDIDNHTYLTSEEGPDKPAGMMVIPPELVAGIPDLDKVANAARHNGWKYLLHDSALGGARMFVMIPDPAGRFDRWMLLNVDDTGKAFDPTTMSMLVVQKQDASGNVLPKVRLNFRDWSVVGSTDTTNGAYGPAGSYHLELDEGRDGKCFSCHVSGVRKLIPRHTATLAAKPVKGEAGYTDDDSAPAPADFGFTRMTELNARLASYGLPDWTGLFDVTNGPALGAGQTCTNCHTGSYRGVLTIFASNDQVHQKLVNELTMPPDNASVNLLERQFAKNPPLTTADETALTAATASHTKVYNDFQAARLPTLSAWLLQTDCQ